MNRIMRLAVFALLICAVAIACGCAAKRPMTKAMAPSEVVPDSVQTGGLVGIEALAGE